MELPAKQHCKFLPIQPIYLENGPNKLYWQCCLADSSKTAPTILFFSIAMCADYSFKLISIVHWVPQFFMHNKSILGWVKTFCGIPWQHKRPAKNIEWNPYPNELQAGRFLGKEAGSNKKGMNWLHRSISKDDISKLFINFQRLECSNRILRCNQ